MELYPRITLQSPHESTNVRPPYPLARLSLLIEVRAQQQGLESDPVTQIPLSITGLLKPQFRDLPTDRIRVSLLSFELLLQRIERECGIQFDATRDKLGWVEEALLSGKEKQFRTVVNEITFHNAVGVSQLLTTQSKPPQEIIFHLWSPALKESSAGEAPHSQTKTAPPPLVRLFNEADPSSDADQSRGGADQSCGGADQSRGDVDQSRCGADQSRCGADQSRGGADQSRGGADQSCGGVDQSCERNGTPQRSLVGREGYTDHDSDMNPEKTGASELDYDDPEDGEYEDRDSDREDEETQGNSPGSTTTNAIDDKLSSLNSGSEELQTPSEYPAKVGATELNLGDLLETIGPDDIRGEERQPGETDEEYKLRRAEEIQMIGELESQRLRDQLESKVCEQLDDGKWHFTCQFLRHAEAQKEPKFCVKIPGFARRLLPCQAHCVVRTLVMHHGDEHSCFHGHAMGVGKTTVAIATCHLQHIINLMYNEIGKHPDQHVQDGGPGYESIPCPSNLAMRKKFGLDCPCSPLNPTWIAVKSLGVNVVFAPLALLKNWCTEWTQCYANSSGEITDQSNPLRMQLVLGHRNAKVSNRNALTPDKLELMRCNQVQEVEDAAPRCTGRLENGQVICITTAQSFQRQIGNKFLAEHTFTYQPEDVLVNRTDGTTQIRKPREKSRKWPYYKLVVASVWRDEAHLDRLQTSPTIQVLTRGFFKLPQNRGIHFNIMSGTLLTTGPTDIAHYISLMVTKTWGRHDVLQRWRDGAAIRLGKDWDQLVRSGRFEKVVVQRIIGELKPLIEALVLRFTPESNFLGTGPVIKLPPNYYEEVECTHPEEWTAKLEQDKQEEDREYARKESKRRRDHIKKYSNDNNYLPLRTEGVTFHYRSRLYASFPFLMNIRTIGGENLRFTEAEWDERSKAGEWKGMEEPYRKYIQEIAASSGKLAMIKQKIDEWANFIDGEGLPARLIFCSYFFTGARIIYLYMVHVLKIPQDSIVYLHKLLNQKDIDNRLATFQGNDGDKHRARPRPRYIVATTASFGVGLTLSEVIAIGLLEPDYRVATELQVFCRHCRLGNKNKQTYSWLFYAKGNAREDKIRQVNRARKQIDRTLEGKRSDAQ